MHDNSQIIKKRKWRVIFFVLKGDDIRKKIPGYHLNTKIHSPRYHELMFAKEYRSIFVILLSEQ